MFMTQKMDRFWIALGLSSDELKAVKGRWVLYSGIVAMGMASIGLMVGIVGNIAGLSA